MHCVIKQHCRMKNELTLWMHMMLVVEVKKKAMLEKLQPKGSCVVADVLLLSLFQSHVCLLHLFPIINLMYSLWEFKNVFTLFSFKLFSLRNCLKILNLTSVYTSFTFHFKFSCWFQRSVWNLKEGSNEFEEWHICKIKLSLNIKQ